MKPLRGAGYLVALRLSMTPATHAAAQVPDHLECYRDPLKLAGIVDLNTPQFGPETGCKVPGVGFEPTRPCGQGILSPSRLPVPPPRRIVEPRTYRAAPVSAPQTIPATMLPTDTSTAALRRSR